MSGTGQQDVRGGGARSARVAWIVAAVAVLALVAVSVWAFAGRGTTPTPTPSPTPTATVPTQSGTASGSPSSSTSPTETPTTAPMPWRAWTFTDTTQSPPSAQLWVDTGGGPVRVDAIESAVLRPIAWTGPSHRTLVYEYGQDLFELHAVTFDAAGVVAQGPHALVVAGLPTSGEAFGQADGGFVWVWPSSTSTDRWRIADVSDDLRATVRPGSVGGLPLAVSGSDVVSTEDVGARVRFTHGTTSHAYPLCAQGVGGVTPEVLGRVAINCGEGGDLHVVTVAAAAAGTASAFRVLPKADGDAVRQMWWTPAGVLLLSSSPEGPAAPVRTHVWQDGQWVDARTQGVLAQAFPSLAVTWDLVSDGTTTTWRDSVEGTSVGAPAGVDGSFMPTLVWRG